MILRAIHEWSTQCTPTIIGNKNVMNEARLDRRIHTANYDQAIQACNALTL
jgi:hypothetical protein